MASEFHLFTDMFNQLNVALESNISTVATNVISGIGPVAETLLFIYVSLWGWTTLRGMISEPITDGITRIVRLSVICTIALQIGYYNGFISNFLWKSPEALASLISTGSSDTLSNVSYLDDLWSKIYDFGSKYMDAAHASPSIMPDFSLLITGGVIWAIGIAALGYCAFLMVLSKIALAVLLGVGPIFVLMLIFDGTKRFFESWLGQALNYVFLIALTSSTIMLIFSILKNYLGTAAATTDSSIPAAFPAICFSAVAFLVFMQITSIASALGGGAAISTLGAVGWVIRKTFDTLDRLRPTNLRRSVNKAKSDVKIAAGAAKSVASAPQAVYRKITQSRANRVANSK